MGNPPPRRRENCGAPSARGSCERELNRSILGPSAMAEAALEPPRSIRLQFMQALAALGVGLPTTFRPAGNRRSRLADVRAIGREWVRLR